MSDQTSTMWESKMRAETITKLRSLADSLESETGTLDKISEHCERGTKLALITVEFSDAERFAGMFSWVRHG